MSMLPGARVGQYEIVAPLGAGGMGEVYRARDPKLGRDVALKILPELFTSDADRLARFRREAQVLASLNHPNIAAIYGVEDSGSTHALVMELVEGEDLAAVIAGGQRQPEAESGGSRPRDTNARQARGGGAPRGLNIDDATAIARQVADALEAAHEQGVVHRDLKPANIKVRADGTVKVLDFGLAKSVDAAQDRGPRDTQNSPTMTSPAMTAMGMILGTAAYMSPEQARGKPVDRRADIWAFGVVLYEMLTGRPAFAGDAVSDLLVSVLRDTPDFSALPAGTPTSIRRLLQRCLEKDPKKRLSAIADARLELDDLDAAPPPAAASDVPPRRSMTVTVIAALALAGIAGAAAWYAKPGATLPHRLLELPASIAASSRVALAPDGTHVAYIHDGHIFVRALDGGTSQEVATISTSAGSMFPNTLFWSPDSKTVGFSADAEIRTVPAGGGPVFVVAKIPATGDAIVTRWFHDGTIVFAAWRESVYAVPATGGTPVVTMAIDPATEIDVHHISEAPNGGLIAMIHQRSGDRGVTVLAARGGGAGRQRVVLTEDQNITGVDYAAPGFVIFGRQKTNAGLWVAPFTGGPIDVSHATLLQAGALQPDIADDGSLMAVLPAATRMAPVWIDRTGAVSVIPGAPLAGDGAGFSLSPDGRRMAMVVGGEQAAALGEDDTALIVRDLVTGADTRLTARPMDGRRPTAGLISDPSWFPSGDRILLASGEVEAGHLVVQRADDASPAREFAAGLTVGRIAGDGRALAGIQDDRGRFRLMYAPVSVDGVVGKAQRVFQDDDPIVDDYDVSFDGTLVVYAVRQVSGQHGVFLAHFPTGRDARQVAEDAERPRFSRDGREVFYLKTVAGAGGPPSRALMSRAVTAKPEVALGAAATVFGGETAALMAPPGYNVAPDGRRFFTLKSVPPAPGEGRRLLWIQNWLAAIKRG
jgi:serine/threonine-protein kinase